MTRKHAAFIFVCQSVTLSIVTYLYMTGFFDTEGGKYVDLFLTFGVLPMAWLVITVQARQVKASGRGVCWCGWCSFIADSVSYIVRLKQGKCRDANIYFKNEWLNA